MSTLITGSYAYDTIMVFPDAFKNHIIPDKVHILNVCFMVPEMRKEFGGCAGNIAYNLKLLGGDPLPMATVGEDFKPYRKWLKKKGIKRRHIKKIKGAFTAQAYLTTDIDDNQIIAFHPGAMNEAHKNQISDAKGIDLGILGPDGKQAMIEHAEQFAQAGIPFFFDPGQGLPMFNGEELKRFIALSDYTVVNDYESELLSRNTGLTIEQIAAQVDALIITRGGKGAEIYADGKVINIPIAKAKKTVDPTGCGDAFRAGLLYGVTHQLDWETTGRIAALLGSIKIEHAGTQNHHFSKQSFEDAYQAHFGDKIDL